MSEPLQTLSALSAKTTALVLIDLQRGILPFAQGPHSAEQVLGASARLTKRFRELGAPVVLVRVGWAPDYADAPRQPVDRPAPTPPGGLPPQWWEQPAELEVAPTDIQITKRQWGAFYGTELDLQLRRRGITTIVLGGISTHVGVESTARAGWEHGYALVLAEDAMSSTDAAMHRSSVENVFPRLGRVRDTATILAALTA
ncbi:Isochorismatase family protein YecD [Ralstonia psammae]|uniref:Isochorismatase family protein YecD n=1 Tax=Ralstonia psammae TaxID=3058598 RepID=A0ABN9IW67_9RALS|nr:hydrolase [Ralstonia sp. LMG 19083]CAJ0794065.1 Isochorismatase family protein YecD [Ralstonia sp. LMG 19083]